MCYGGYIGYVMVWDVVKKIECKFVVIDVGGLFDVEKVWIVDVVVDVLV